MSTDTTSNSKKKVKSKLEISTRDEGIRIYSKMYKHNSTKGSWEKRVMILKDTSLYELGGIDDTIAKSVTVILGYKLEPNYQVRFSLS